MGTWSAAIFGNDTSCEVKEYFFGQYNIGKEPASIQKEIYEIYADSLEDLEEKYNILFALAHCLWQTRSLDQELLSSVTQIVSDGSDLAVCRQLDADSKFLREREKALSKFIADIKIPKETAKKRVKPPEPIDSIYKNGCCLAFQYKNGNWGVVITVNSKFFRRKATVYYAQTDVEQKALPTLQDVYSAHIIGGEFGKYRGLHLYGAHFIGMKEIPRLSSYNETFFTIIGYLPEWKNAYMSSSGGRPPYSQENVDDFIAIMQGYFTNRLIDPSPRGMTTTETVEEINRFFLANENE